MHDLSYGPLLTIAGLPGLIPAWQRPGDEWLALNRDYALRLGPGQHCLTARLRSAQAQHLLVEVNAYEGVHLSGIPECDGHPRLLPCGNVYTVPVPAGEFQLRAQTTGDGDATGFTVRLSAHDGSPALGVEALAPQQTVNLAPDVRLPVASLSPWHHHNQLMSAPGLLAYQPGQDWAAWHAALSGKLRELLHEPPSAPATSRLIERGDLEPGLAHFLVLLSSQPGVQVVAHLLLPQRPNGAGLLCLHGHGYVYGETLGLDGGDPAQRLQIERANYAYAREAARRGYVVLAPELRGWGYRADPPRPPKDACDARFFRAVHYGENMVAAQLCDLRVALTYLLSRPEVEAGRVGCLGLSTGGRMTMYLAATDERIKVAIPSGCLNTFKERLSIASSCGTQFVPGLLRYCDTPDLFGLIAPRPLLLEHGANDGTSPELFATEAYRQVQRIYNAAGAAERLALDVFPGGHRWNGELAWPWLERWL